MLLAHHVNQFDPICRKLRYLPPPEWFIPLKPPIAAQSDIEAFAILTAWLTLRQRLLDTCDATDLFDKEVDQQPDSSNARAFGDDQHVQRNGRQRIIRQNYLKLTGRQEIADKPSMSRRDLAALQSADNHDVGRLLEFARS